MSLYQRCSDVTDDSSCSVPGAAGDGICSNATGNGSYFVPGTTGNGICSDATGNCSCSISSALGNSICSNVWHTWKSKETVLRFCEDIFMNTYAAEVTKWDGTYGNMFQMCNPEELVKVNWDGVISYNVNANMYIL